MKKQLPLGLVLEGSSSRSSLLHLPGIAQELGPIKCGAIGLARRFSNLIQGGYAVAGYEELQSAQVVLLRVPDAAVLRIIDELCSSELVLSRLSFVLCETWLSTDSLERLRERGASVATLSRLPTVERNWFVLEGDAGASRSVRRVIDRHQGRAFEMKTGSKHLLFAAELLSTVLPIPLLLAAQTSLRSAGITGNDIAALVDQMTSKAVREVIKGVRIPLDVTPPECSWGLGSQYLAALKEKEPALASFIQQEQSASAKLINEAWKNAIDGD